MNREAKDKEPKRVNKLVRRAKRWTKAYIVIVTSFTIIFVSLNQSWWSFDYELNQLGDFLTGVFAPIGFLWLVVGYLVQAEEFSTQAEELRNQTEQLRAEVKATKLLGFV